MAQSVDPILLDSTGQDIVTALNAIANKTVDSALSTTSVNPVQNKVITGEINGIKEKIPSGASSSNKMATANDITGVQNAVKANTKLIKDTVGFSGKNLLKNIFNSLTYADVTYTVNADKSISTSGTATADMFNRIANFTVPKTGKYIVSGVTGGSLNTYLLFIRPDPADGTSWSIIDGEVELNLDVSKKYICNYVIYNGTDVDGVTVYPMLRDASILDNTYEPYQEDVSTILRKAQVIQGKNMIPYPYSYPDVKVQSGLTYKVNDDKSITISPGTSTQSSYYLHDELDLGIPLKGGRKYILSSDGYFNESCYLFCRVYYDADLSNNVVFRTQESSKVVIDLTNISEVFAVRCGITVANGFVVSNPITIKPMIYDINIENDSYEPYFKDVLKDSMLPRSEQAVLGAKNLLPNKGVSKEENGITFTVNSDGSVTVDGTATANAQFYITPATQAEQIYIDKPMILSGCPIGGANDTYYIRVDRYNGNTYVDGFSDLGNGVKLPVNYGFRGFRITIYSGVTLNNAVFKPMLRLASDPNDTYVPYAPTNAELATVDRSSDIEAVVGTLNSQNNYATKVGRLLSFCVRVDGVTCNAYEVIAKIKNVNYRYNDTFIIGKIGGGGDVIGFQIGNMGANMEIRPMIALNNQNVTVFNATIPIK